MEKMFRLRKPDCGDVADVLIPERQELEEVYHKGRPTQ